MVVTHKIKIDLSRNNLRPPVHVMQDDKYSRNLEITLVDNGAAWAPPSDATVIVRYRKPDGTGGNYDTLPDGTPAGSIAGNVVTVALAPQVCTAPGVVKLAVGLVAGETEINTFAVDIDVQRNPGVNVASEDYYKIAGSIADSGWPANMYLGTDENGKVVAVEAPEGAVSTAQPTDIKMVRSGQTVTITTTRKDGSPVVDTIELDEHDYPVSGVFNGVACTITMEGF